MADSQGPTPLTFALGDVVAHVGLTHAHSSSGVGGCDFIITDADAETGEVLYAVNGVEWFSKETLVFVKPATPESVAYAINRAYGDVGADEGGQHG